MRRTRCFVSIVLLYLVLPMHGLAKDVRIVHLEKPTSEGVYKYSGDGQYARVNQLLPIPVKVKAVNKDGQPLRGVGLHFQFISTPGKATGHEITDLIVLTDSNGIARTNVILGSEPGMYEVLVKPIGNFRGNDLVYAFHARGNKWVFFLFIGLVGGLGLFLLGMDMMSDGMQKSAGDKMRSILSTLTHNRFIAMGVGAFVTMLIQSSSATTVMLVSFVNSRLMRFRQTIGIILGAAIGTTITAQLIAFKLTEYSLLMVGVGFIMYFFFQKEKIKNAGEAILGFGILFFGMHIMSESVSPLRTFQPFVETLIKLESPLIGIVVGAVFTALIQSSSAFIGIMIILAGQGLLTLEACVPLVLGSNIGTAITAILASLKTNRESKKVALAHTLFKVVGTLILIWIIPFFIKLVLYISPGVVGVQDNLPRQIANAHTVFNVFVTILFLPFTNLTARLINRIVSSSPREKTTSSLASLEYKFRKTPSLALNMAKQETVKMGKMIVTMLDHIFEVFIEKNPEGIKKVDQLEEEIDQQHAGINKLVYRLLRANIENKRAEEGFQILYASKELEQIADIISLNLKVRAEKWMESQERFSDEGKEELTRYFEKIRENLIKSIKVFEEQNLNKAVELKKKIKEIRALAKDLELEHFTRVQKEISESVSSSKTHLEIIGMLNAMNRHLSDILKIFISGKTLQG